MQALLVVGREHARALRLDDLAVPHVQLEDLVDLPGLGKVQLRVGVLWTVVQHLGDEALKTKKENRA